MGPAFLLFGSVCYHSAIVQKDMAEAERRIEEARRTKAEVLDLGDLALSELPASLGDLPHLRQLYLGRFFWPYDRERHPFSNLSPLARLTLLEVLRLTYCPGVTDLSPLADIQGLQNIDLSFCPGVTDLAPLAGIQGLRNLDLSYCTGVTDLAPLAHIQGLQNLDLSDCTEVTDLAPLAHIQGLQNLNLSYCIGVTNLTPLASMQVLRTLDLSLCDEVADLAPVAAIQGLKELKLWQVRIPPSILGALSNHPLLTKLVASESVGIPREVLSRNEFDDCLPRLRAYFSELALGAESENEVKVILLGNGRVGKTQLCRRLRGEDFDESIESTHGVQIWRTPLRIRVQGQEELFQINWWDFGGQDIYHGTHALFLRSRAVFLILWTPTLENRHEYTENGIPLRNQPLAYWLDYVRTLAGVESPVIVVQSQCDRLEDRRSAGPRPDAFKFFETCSYSAKGKEELGREALEAHLGDAIRYLLDRGGRLEIGQGRAEVRRQLYKWRAQDQKRKPEKRRHRTLTVEEFQSLCDKVGNVSWEHALDYFHHTGVVFYQPNLFANRIILDQDWALEAIYAVFDRGRSAPWLIESGGRFTREDLALMVWQRHSIEEQRLFLGLMESCGVCFRCGKSFQGGPRYIAPDLLPKLEVVASRLHAWKEEPGMPTLRLAYRFFHPAVIRGLMSEVGSQAGTFAEYWKYGFWLKDGPRDTQILVNFEGTSTNEAPGAGALVLKAQERDPLGLLRQIRQMIFWQRIGEEPEEYLTLEGTTVARSALANAIGGQVLDIQGQAVSAAPFVAFFEDYRLASESEGKEKAMEPTLTPVPLDPDEKPQEVYISYAWGDDTPAGKTRAEVVDRLCSALEKDGFHPIRDRDQIRIGDLISLFIERLTRGDWVVTVISDKYLRSPYCMYEIYRLWQKYQEDPQALSRHVVPIVLPEVKIGRLGERAVYVEHWVDEAESAKKVLGNKKLMLHLSDKSVREARLTQRFADHVDDILHFLNDVLMPRQLDAHFEGDFQAVREALRRRIQGEE